MSEQAQKSQNRYLLPASRRIDATCRRRPITLAKPLRERLILSEDFRVAQAGVMRLCAEDAVPPDRACAGEAVPPPLVLGAEHRRDSAPAVSRAKEGVKRRRSDASDLAAKIAALETAIARTVDRWEPDGVSSDAYAGKEAPAMTWVDDADLDAMGVPATQASGPHGTQQTDSASSLSVLEQEVLRAIVADLVRAELRGSLGEQITRNVRKLVRREICRALAENDPTSFAKLQAEPDL